MKAFAPSIVAAAAAAAIALTPASALAVEHELSFGLEGGLLLPGFDSPDPTAFHLASWTAGGAVQWGLTWDLWLLTRFSVSSFSAKVPETRDYRGHELLGERHFDALTFQTEVGVRYDLIGGYALSLYVEGGFSFLWSGYSSQQFLNAQGMDFGIEVQDEGQAALLVSGGLSVEYRLLDLLLICLGARFGRTVTPGLYQHHLVVTTAVSFPLFL